MNYLTSPSFNSEQDQLRGRLGNVFRVLANPKDQRQEEALQLRQKVSSAWPVQVAQNKWFPWPTTDAPRGSRQLNGLSSPKKGMLRFLGYHVGETRPTPPELRRCILEYAFECHLPPLCGRDYYLQWGEPGTAQRLKKLADTLASLTRNAKRQDALHEKAIDDWERDLAFLRERYYVNFHFLLACD